MPIYSYQVSINDPYYSWGFSNSLFLILPITSFPFPRFQSIFLEPGHLGMISSLMLYMIRYNMRSWQGIIIFLSSLLSMSLAAYMLLFLGMVIYKLSFGNLHIFLKPYYCDWNMMKIRDLKEIIGYQRILSTIIITNSIKQNMSF